MRYLFDVTRKETRRRRGRTTALTACLMLVAGVALAPTAQATTYSRSFSTTKQIYSSEIGRCVVVTLSGKMTYSLKARTSYHGTYSNRKVVAPKVTVKTKSSCSGSAASVTKLTATQRWYDKVCSLNSGISVSAPWGVSVSATPSCGSVRVANRKTTYGSGSTFTQANSNTKVSLKNGGIWDAIAWSSSPYDKTQKWSPLCVNAAATVTAYRGTKSDTLGFTFAPCVKH